MPICNQGIFILPAAMSQEAHRERLYRADRKTSTKSITRQDPSSKGGTTDLKAWQLPPTYEEFVKQSGKFGCL